jgi:hypothetical protein
VALYRIPFTPKTHWLCGFHVAATGTGRHDTWNSTLRIDTADPPHMTIVFSFYRYPAVRASNNTGSRLYISPRKPRGMTAQNNHAIQHGLRHVPQDIEDSSGPPGKVCVVWWCDWVMGAFAIRFSPMPPGITENLVPGVGEFSSQYVLAQRNMQYLFKL